MGQNKRPNEQHAKNVFIVKTGTNETRFPAPEFSSQAVFDYAAGRPVFVRVGDSDYRVVRP